MAPQLEDEDGIAIPPAPNWYGSALADWGMGSNAIYAYAARNAIVLLRPDGGKGSAPDRPTPQTSSSHSRPHSANVSFAGTLVGHNNRVTALAFARYPGVEHLLLSGSAERGIVAGHGESHRGGQSRADLHRRRRRRQVQGGVATHWFLRQ